MGNTRNSTKREERKMSHKNIVKKFRSIFLVGTVLLSIISITGCGHKAIFKEKTDPNEIVPIDVKDIEPDMYYIKNGTKFYMVYQPKGNSASQYSPESVYWMQKDESLMPDYYRGEIIAYASENSSLKPLQIQRYKYNGYSFGLYGAEIDDDGYISFSVKKNTIEDSDMGKILSRAKSDTIRLVSIDDKPVTKKNLNNAGCITGLKKNKEYHLTFYAGTYYQTATIKADEKFLQYYEAYVIEKAENTKNGYLKFSMPDDAKSGYYMIEGAGFFKYYNFKRREKSEAKADMNDAFYTSQNEQFAQYSQQYFALVSEDTKDAVFQITYDTNGYTDNDIICTLIAPDDQTVYEMPALNGVATVTLDKAVAGRYTMNIYPKDIKVENAEVISGYTQKDAICDKETETLKKDDSFIMFSADIVGDDYKEDDVWGTVTYEDGTSYEMEYDHDTGKMEYLMDYAKKGKYTIEIYHYENIAIQNIRARKDESHTSHEVINIEE